ncbi:uncharacterized protein LOC116670579 [Etheostoma spectabile]|uniref:uncharacterized protein LOC116670579 n=1 Tax=Etheostoma spectabile TaxID=54343 RepID=UPI0013AEF313|nr:uncharacterized protein LOC116670579 [Etheostoma spectabile]
MAAVTELSFLLVALINSIHAGEHIIIQEEGSSYTFTPPKNTISCLISRFVGGENLVLWNTSDLWSNQSSVPRPLKRRRVSRVKTSSYTIRRLTQSDSGPYREECWTEGTVTHGTNITIMVCSSSSVGRRDIRARLGETVDLPCDRAAGNQYVQWLKKDSRYNQGTWSRVFGDKTTSEIEDVRGRYQVVTNSSDLRVSNVTATDFRWYSCLVMDQQQCVSSETLALRPLYEVIHGSVGETVVLPCTVADSTDEQPPHWRKYNPKTHSYHDPGLLNQTDCSVDQNYSLVFPSLMLHHSGRYHCDASWREQLYDLVVCPTFGPPAVELFSEGDDVTLRCTDRRKGRGHLWFIKSDRTEGRVFNVKPDQSMSRVRWNYDNGNLVISNISVGDLGGYWCAVIDDDDFLCESAERTILVYIEPFGIYSTFFKVRCSVLSVLLLMFCAATGLDDRVHGSRKEVEEEQCVCSFIVDSEEQSGDDN